MDPNPLEESECLNYRDHAQPWRTMPESTGFNRCPRCQGTVAPESLEGHCPRCLAQLALDSSEAFFDDSPFGNTERLPRRFGDYELEALVGRGGMGVVYRARQLSLNREVAIKILPGGEFASPEFRRRFHAEARTAASLTHPHIVTIHDVGEHEGLPYFAMEYVAGHTLADVIRTGASPPETAARLCRDIARAVHFAHEHGVLHRDLKPANVLLDSFDHPRLVDFGLASFLSANPEITRPEQTLGTPAYMPPEQVAGNHRSIGRGSDVYALGAILYHLLTGRPTFEGETLPQILRQIESEEPVPPRRLNPGIPQDLQTICLKCLEKDPQKRYRDAQSFAEELDRFLHSEPIHARPRGTLGKFWLWCRRRPAIAIAIASGVILLVLTAGGTSMAAWRIRLAQQNENQQRLAAEAANQQLRSANAELARTIDLVELQQVESLFTANDASTAIAHLAAILRRAPSNTVAASRMVSALIHRNWALPTGRILHGRQVSTVQFSPDGTWILSTSWDRTARLRRTEDTETKHVLRHTAPVLAAAFNPASDRIATGCEDGSVHLWQTDSGAESIPPLSHSGKIIHLEFNPAGNRLLVVSDSARAHVRDATSGSSLSEYGKDERHITMGRFNPRGDGVATATDDGAIQLWNDGAKSGFIEIPAHQGKILWLAFSPDGLRLASASTDRTARLWQVSNGKPLSPPLPHEDTVHHVAFDAPGLFVLTTSFDGHVRFWNPKNGFPMERTMIHEGGVTYGTFNQAGTLAVTVGLDHAARVWDAKTGVPYCQPLRHAERIVHAAFNPASDRLATASYDRQVQIWDVRPRRAKPIAFNHIANLLRSHFSPDGSRLLLGDEDGAVVVLQSETGERSVLENGRRARVNSLRWDASGRDFITGLADGTAQLWVSTPNGFQPTRTWQHTGEVMTAEFSRDGTRVLTASRDGTARVWNAHTGETVGSAVRHSKAVRVARFSPDGSRFATGAEDGSGEIWDGNATRRIAGPFRHIDQILDLDFSPDGSRLVTASGDNSARIWDATTGKPVGRPLQHRRTVTQAAFLPDGRRIATASLDLTTRVWDAATGEALTPPMKHDSPVGRMDVSVDGKQLVSGCWNGHVRVWDTQTGMALTDWFQASGAVQDLRMDTKHSRIAALSDNNALVWRLPQVETPVPAWFTVFAEDIAGARMTDSGNVYESTHRRTQLSAEDDTAPVRTGFYRRLQEWLVADPEMRSRLEF